MKSHPVFEKLRIFAPGPTPVPTEVLAALSRPPLHHRTQEFSEILERTKDNLKYLFQTESPVTLFSASGTGAMEATIANLFVPEDEVIVVDGGKFGERWEKIALRFGLKPHRVSVPWGEAVSVETIESGLKAHPNAKAVLFQASETSTGVQHPVKAIADCVHQHSQALVVVDAITGLGVFELPMDRWGLDAVVSGSQKALMLPPGLAFLALSEKAQELRKRGGCPRFYFDLDAEDKAAASGQTAWTPSVSLVEGLDVVLQGIRRTGLETLYQFHARLAGATRAGALGMGLELFCKETPSPAVTSICVPDSVDGKKIVSHLRDRFGVTIAGGQDAYKGKIFRIGHLGFYDELDVLTVLSAVELTLKTLGHSLELGSGTGAASQYFFENQ